MSYVKVVEYQARGLVHFHSLLRLDGPRERPHPAPDLDLDVFASAVRSSTSTALVPSLAEADMSVRWGPQIDIKCMGQRDAIAGYLAKYATKSTDDGGALDHRIRRPGEIELLQVNPHLRRLVRTCWDLGGDSRFESLRLRQWAHTLGYRGHWTTKSRNYSTTFTALREKRRVHRGGNALDQQPELRMSQWTFAGRGYMLKGSGDDR